ncbi:hypothetical protein HAX54_038675 [Datura stramonium]|uniref:Uncharacterized protein n=1 Tax=Datura stramonium TaxID=4076 RepID=A0ABS8VND4_DATST|nr:hypothetical protein [Datura stramonium]
MVDISATTINKMLYGPEFTPATRMTELEYKLSDRHNQRLWLAQKYFGSSAVPTIPDRRRQCFGRRKENIVSQPEVRVPIEHGAARADLETHATKSGQGEGMVEAPTNMARATTGTEPMSLVGPPHTSSAVGVTPREESNETSSTAPQAITATLKPYAILHACIDDMEARVNDRIKDLIMLDLSKFAVTLKRAQDDIVRLQQERQNQEFPITIFEELG